MSAPKKPTECSGAPPRLSDVQNVHQLEHAARDVLDEAAFAYLAGGADDMRTATRNVTAFHDVGIRARRLVDVSQIDTTVTLFGETHETPILLAPVGFQRLFDPDAELTSARAASARGHTLILSSVSSRPIAAVRDAAGRPVWFQLYPTPDRRITRGLLERAEAAGCPVLVLTVDTPVFGNRERHDDQLSEMLGSNDLLVNYAGLGDFEHVEDASMTWDMVGWLRENCGMRIVLKGIVTREDAELAVAHGADGLVVSNHGGRQEESDRATIECLPEVADAVAGRIPVLFDSGIRRGTDIFKALALGADAVCVGRPYVWGLAAFGQEGVEHALGLLRSELVRTMQLAGVASIADIGASRVVHSWA